MRIVLVGVSHRTAPLDLRERIVFSAEQAARAGRELCAEHGLSEAVVVSTCNRSEIYGVPTEPQGISQATLGSYISRFHGVPAAELDACLYDRRDSDAVEHLFRVAAGLDSMLLGEAEILGQVRDAYKTAFGAGSTGTVLNRLFQSALEVGKRVRAETELGTRPMSAAFAGVKLAEQIFGALRKQRALILGAGTVAEQAVEHLRNRGIGQVLVANRSKERGEELARRFGGERVEWTALQPALAKPEILITSVASPEAVLTRAMIEQAMHERKNRALFLIDLGVPRNVEPAVEELYNVYLYNIDNLTQIVEQNRRARQEEIPRAEGIVGEHVAKFEGWQGGVLMHALLDELRDKLRDEREAFLHEHRALIRQLSAEDRRRFGALAEEMLEHAVNQPEPLVRRKDLRPRPEEIDAVREFFGLAREKS
jgi:glutamyl-tRNA reductase